MNKVVDPIQELSVSNVSKITILQMVVLQMPILHLDVDWYSQDQRESKKHLIRTKIINQSILCIDFVSTNLNESGSLTFLRFGISKYYQYVICRNTF